MGKQGKNFEDIMAAAAFAEAGEAETAREIIKGNGKALLVLTGREHDRKAFKYALNLSRRLGVAIEALYVPGEGSAGGLIEEFREEARKESVEFSTVTKSGCIKKAVINHSQNRRDIQFVIIESTGSLNIDCTQGDKKLQGLWRRLECPLVLVSELETT